MPRTPGVNGLVKVAAIGQFDPILIRHGIHIPAAAPGGVEGIVFKYVSFPVGIEQKRGVGE